VPLHLAASAAFSLIYMVLRAVLGQVQDWFGGHTIAFWQAFQPLLVKSFHYNLLIYWVILNVAHAFDFYREARERELRTSELERHLAQARLQALQMQLNPHFLFNTLHAISALMHKDVELADRMIARLSDLLRYALESTDAQEVSLEQELDFLERYLEIEQTRFGDRLVVHREIDPHALDARVPNLILQPIVENAIRHGIEPHARHGQIRLSARRDNGVLHLEVQDNGKGLPPDHGPMEEGVGLSNTRARLEELYGDRYRFEFRNAKEGGLIVHMVIPCSAAQEPHAASERIS
jgi:sensor histidine kinase YesM